MVSEHKLIQAGATKRKFKAQEIIIEEGTEAQFYFQLITGKVRWVNIADDGSEIIQDMIMAGEPVGEIPIFDNLPYAASALAEEDSEVYVLPKEVMQNLMTYDAEILMSFDRLFARRLRYKFMALKEFTNKPPIHRMRVLFNYFKSTGRNVCGNCCRVKLTRQQIANMTGLRVETVIRSIRTMNSANEVHIVHGKIYLEDKSYGLCDEC